MKTWKLEKNEIHDQERRKESEEYGTVRKYTLDLVPTMAQLELFADKMAHSGKLRSQQRKERGRKQRREVLALLYLRDYRLIVGESRDLCRSHCYYDSIF